MKVLRVINSMNPLLGGVSQGIRNSIPEWDQNGHTTHVVCLDQIEDDFIKNETIKLIVLGPSKSSWGYSSYLLPWLLKNIYEYDSIVIEGLWQYHGYAVYRAVKKLKKKFPDKVLPKIVVMPHGMLDPYFQKAAERKLKAIRNLIYWLFIESKIVNSADAMFFTCQQELLLARETFKSYRPKKEINVGFGIQSPPTFSQSMLDKLFAEYPKLKNRKFILFLSRIHIKKGADLLLNAYIDIYKNLNMKIESDIVIAGPGMDSEYGRKLMEIKEESEMQDHIHFVGMLSGDTKWGVFYAADAYALTSHQENFGIAVAEALACKKPVLISKKINIWSDIINSGAGLAENDDQQGVNRLIENWKKTSNHEKEQMSNKALQCFHENFTIKTSTKTYIEAVKNLIN